MSFMHYSRIYYLLFSSLLSPSLVVDLWNSTDLYMGRASLRLAGEQRVSVVLVGDMERTSFYGARDGILVGDLFNFYNSKASLCTFTIFFCKPYTNCLQLADYARIAYSSAFILAFALLRAVTSSLSFMVCPLKKSRYSSK